MKNFLQKVNQSLNKAFGNQLTLIFCVESYNITTDTKTTTEYDRLMFCDEPKNVDIRLIDGANYLAGDLIVPIDYNALIAARTLETGDPSNLFTALRPFNVTTGGIIAGTDVVIIGSLRYKIMSINPVDWIGSEPAAYQLTLRK